MPTEDLTVVCVKWGDWCAPFGAEYVNRLYNAVERRLTMPHRFVCFTDDREGLSEGIVVRDLPANLQGWLWEQVYPNRKLRRYRKFMRLAYLPLRGRDRRAGLEEDRKATSYPVDLRGYYNKLYLFKPGVLSGRCLFIDLDTVLVGGIDELADYDGDFCILRDLEHAKQYGSGVMMFRPEACGAIWTEYVKRGCPLFRMGDQEFIQQVLPDADFFQDRLPGQVVSYKIHCQKRGVPDYARVVCFHGLPRPHMVSDPYILKAWRGDE